MNIFKKTANEVVEQLESTQNLLNESQEQVESLIEQNRTLAEEKSTLSGEIEFLNPKVTELESEKEELENKIAELEESQSEFDEKLSVALSAKLAELGIDEEIETDDEDENLTVTEKFKSLSGKEAVEFFDRHKAEIFKHL